MKFIILIVSLFTLQFVHAQWEKKQSIELIPGAIWEVDLIGNVYIANRSSIVKMDTSGQKRYEQSIKSLGNISQIEPINTMKILVFSEEQQTFSILDNTLSSTNTTFDLSELEFGYVPFVASSSQPSKLWVYDQLNLNWCFWIMVAPNKHKKSPTLEVYWDQRK